MDSDDAIINPRRLPKEKQIPDIGLLAVNPADMNGLLRSTALKDFKQRFLFHAKLFSDGNIFIAGPAVGAPMAVMTLEKLIALGAKIIILYSWCGSLQPVLGLREILLPNTFISEEGTSRHYPLSNPALPDRLLQENLLQFLSSQNHICREGSIWTTDAPYRETTSKVEQYGQQGALGVDMEYSALCTVASFRKIRFGALHFVSDLLYLPEWSPLHSDKTFLRKSRDLLISVIQFAHTFTMKQS